MTAEASDDGVGDSDTAVSAGSDPDADTEDFPETEPSDGADGPLGCAEAGCELHGSAGREGEPITSAARTKSFAGIVSISTAGDFCSGTMLTEHWLLTAAHCIDDKNEFNYADVQMAPNSDGVGVPVYGGPVRLYPHPDHDGADYDVGLVHLLSYGVDLSSVGRAKLAASVPATATVAGWGRGSDPGWGASTDCDDATPDHFLRWTGFTTTDNSGLTIKNPDRRECPGDSGGPWMRQISSVTPYQYLQFAVLSGYRWDLFEGYQDIAALLKPAVVWVDATVSSQIPHKFKYSKNAGTVGGYSYHTYAEAGTLLSAFRSGNNLCMDVAATEAGAPVVLAPCSSSWSQVWWLKPTGEIRHPASNLCLDVGSGWAQIQPCITTLPTPGAQRFRYNDDGSLHTGIDFYKCVDVPWSEFVAGTQPQVYACNGTAAQHWDFLW